MSTVRNRKPGPTIFTDKANEVYIEWEGYGSPTGGDVQEIPESVLKSPSFASSVRKGVFEVLDPESAEVVDAINRQTQVHGIAPEAIVETEGDNDIVMAKCLACGVDVAQRVSERHRVPSLCTEHSSLVTEFIPTPTGEMEADGVGKVAWTRATAALSEAAPSQHIQ